MAVNVISSGPGQLVKSGKSSWRKRACARSWEISRLGLGQWFSVLPTHRKHWCLILSPESKIEVIWGVLGYQEF